MIDAPVGLPERIGPYKLLRVLGVGGMGTVYQAVHQELGRVVALKVLEPSSARSEGVLRRFKDEARAAAMPQHENIVVLYEHGEADGFHYLALEFVKGKDLLYYIDQRGQLSNSFSLQVIKQAARALEHAHKHNFVHRDIKPSNFLVTKDKQVKLTDMGLARQLEDIEEDRVTRDGTTVGTVDYMAPEQAKSSHDADIRSDIYALGCTWYHLLTGEVPYPGGTALERLYKHVNDPIPDVRDKNPKVPDATAEVILKMMAKDPAERFQTPTELLEALEALPTRKGPADGDSDSEIERTVIAQRVAKETKPERTAKRGARGKRKKDSDPTFLVAAVVGAGALFFFLAIVLLMQRATAPAEDPELAGLRPVRPGEAPPVVAPAPSPPTTSEPAKDEAPTGGAADPSATSTDEKAETKEPPPAVPAEKKEEPPPAPPMSIFEMDLSNVVSGKQASKEEVERRRKKVRTTLAEAAAARRRREAGAPPREVGGLAPKGLAGLAAAIAGKSAVEQPDDEPEAPTPITKMPRMTLPVDVVERTIEPRKESTLSDTERLLLYGPWMSPPPPPERPARIYPVGRIAESDEEASGCSTSVKQAWNVALPAMGGQADATVWIEVQNNGPLFHGSHEFADRPLVLKAAEGFVPILAYQEVKTSDASSWFSFDNNGRVDVEGIHFVLFAGDIDNVNTAFDLFRHRDGDVTFRRCSFTVLGTHRTRTNLLRVLPGVRSRDHRPRVHFKDCVLRGLATTAIVVESADADVLVENCCFVSRSSELFQIRAADRSDADDERMLRVIDSSLLCGTDLLRVRCAASSPTPLTVLTADSAWISMPNNSRRPMVHVDLVDANEFPRDQIHWRDHRVVYGSWPLMLEAQPAGKPAVTIAENASDWSKLWGDDQPRIFSQDRTLAEIDETFPLRPYPYFAAGPWSFGESSRAVSLGYDPSECLPLTRFWFEVTYGELERLPIALDLGLRDPASGTGTVSLDLDPKTQSLAEEVKKHPKASRIEVRFVGEGRHPIEPVHLVNQSLSLRFPPPPTAPNAVPLTFEPSGAGEALFALEGGSLQVENGRFEWKAGRRAPARFAHLRGGELALYFTRVEAPLVTSASTMTELIRFEAGERTSSEQWNRFLMQATLLSSAAPLVSLEVPMTALFVDNCVFVTQSDALRVTFGERPPQDWFASIEVSKCTFSVAGSAFRVYPFPPKAPLPAYPVLFAIEENIFTDAIDLKGGRESRSRSGSVLAFESDVLTRGVLAWQGNRNAFDRRLNRLAVPEGKESAKHNFDNSRLDWLRIWGKRHEVQPYVGTINFDGRLRSDKVTLEGLQLHPNDPATVMGYDGRQLGADLTLFGLRAKPTTRPQPARAGEDPPGGPLKRSMVAGPSSKSAREKSPSAKKG